MQDETNTTEGTEQRSGADESTAKVVHHYVEVGGDLLAKPGALCDLIEAEGKPTIVFCNTPSDADFVEVLLRKRGVKVRKLIGHISQAKLGSTIEQVRNEEINVLVVTDVAAQGLRLKDFGLCIIHATHSDPEVYLERTGQIGDVDAGPERVVSLVGPLDITHFHYLKKIIQIPIEKSDLPDSGKLASARLEKVRQDALKRNAKQNEKIGSLVQLVVEDEHRDEIIAYLLQNTLEVLPALHQPSESREPSEDYRDSRDRPRDRDRGDRGDRGGRDRDRGGRRGDRRQNGGRYGRDNSDDEMGDRGDSPRRDREPRQSMPSKKEIRLYIGHGTSQGFSKSKFIEILEQNSNTPADEVKRFSERPHYCFVDMTEEFAETTLESLSGLALGEGSNFFIKRAIQIPVPREDVMVRDGSPEEAMAGDEFSEEAPHGSSYDEGEGAEEFEE